MMNSLDTDATGHSRSPLLNRVVCSLVWIVSILVTLFLAVWYILYFFSNIYFLGYPPSVKGIRWNLSHFRPIILTCSTVSWMLLVSVRLSLWHMIVVIKLIFAHVFISPLTSKSSLPHQRTYFMLLVFFPVISLRYLQ